MYEKYIIVTEETKNIKKDQSIIGFQLGARVPYYRGLGISMIEHIELTVDGNKIPDTDILVEIHGNTYSLKQMETEESDRWEFGEVGHIKVLQNNGLSSGRHVITLIFTLRISYMPVLAHRKDSKEIEFN